MLRRNVLIFHAGALGDFVVTWPIVLGAARLYPQSRIICITAQSKGELAERLLHVEWRDSEIGWHALHGDASALPESASRLLAGAHTIVSFVSDGHDAWAGHLRRVAPDSSAIFLTPINPDVPTPAHRQHIDHLGPLPALREAAMQMLSHIQSTGLSVGPPPPVNTVLIHPGSGSARKNWPAQHFAELAGALRERGWQVRITLGEVEREKFTAHQLQVLADSALVVQPTSLVHLAELMLASRFYVGNDSGPTHLAAALGLQVVGLYGGAPPRVWRPAGPRVTVLDAPTLNTIDVPGVMRAIGV